MQIMRGEKRESKSRRADGNEWSGVRNVSANARNVESDENHGEASVVAP